VHEELIASEEKKIRSMNIEVEDAVENLGAEFGKLSTHFNYHMY